MRIQACTVILLLLLVTPVQPVSANEEDSTLEAREAQAEFLPDIETNVSDQHLLCTIHVFYKDQ